MTNKCFIFGVVVFETPDRALRTLLQSFVMIHNGLNIDISVIIQPNSSKDMSKLDISMPSSITVKFLDYVGNIGFGAGHNRIVNALPNDLDFWYIGCNPDGFFLPGSGQAALQYLSEDAHNTLFEARQFPIEHPKTYDRRTLVTPWCSGACFIIHSSLYRKHGGYDERFFMYCEDVDLSWRIKAHGGICRIMPDVLFFHDMSDGRLSPNTQSLQLQSAAMLAQKWRAPDFEAYVRTRADKINLASTIHVGAQDSKLDVINPALRKFANFEYGFSFAKPRW